MKHSESDLMSLQKHNTLWKFEDGIMKFEVV